MVLESGTKTATIGLRPGTDDFGKVVADREKGEIAYSEVKWARPVLERGLGGTPKTVDAILKPGDVIYVKPKEPGDKQTEEDVAGQWSLMQVPKVGGAIVAMDPFTGRILALVGGFSFAQSEFDRAVQARRQPGSSFKPLIYSTALDNGYTPASIIYDGPISIDQGPGMPPWQPKNYEAGSHAGPSTLRYGIEHSRNLMTVRLARDLGMPIISEYARRFGAYDNLMPVLSMSLGAGETTLMRMVGAYSMIANGGVQITPTLIDRVQDRYGRTVWRHDERDCTDCDAKGWHGQAEPELVENRKQILDPITAYQMTSILEGVVQRGTGRRIAALGRPVGGKTGTTNDEKDAWFIGFTPNLVAGVFIGFDNPKPMGRGETGGRVAGPVFLDFMKDALKDEPPVPFRAPPGVKLVRVNLKTGLPAGGGDGTAIMEAFKPGQEPVGAVASSGYGGDEYGGQPDQGGGFYGGGQGQYQPQPQPQPQPRPRQENRGGWRSIIPGGLY
ncbi:Penicillin-binding protein 1A [Methyloligella halotolerans]|uniref:Penicillin-binding protein 1A n=1 Tax=Methyloligella halotolerans TaxID=1177755 RepID=A0A1E2S3B9_9HYPH|nr:Penicillin-binding protein 1A [Methyloligella halotolerans]